MKEPRYALHKGDLPEGVTFGPVLAIDNEFMGLNPWRDRLCLFQVYDGQPGSKVHMVQFDKDRYAAPNVRKLLSDASKLKIFYYARGDMRWLYQYLGVMPENVYCTKIASRIARTYTQGHELEDALRGVLGVKLSKEQQCTDWGASKLTPEQLDYACNDVLHLHALRDALDAMMDREGRRKYAYDLFKCHPAVVQADLGGWYNEDHFAYFQVKSA